MVSHYTLFTKNPEEPESLRKQTDHLLAELNASNQLAETVGQMERHIEARTYTLNNLKENIERATQHYEDLKMFLEAFGVDVKARKLTFDRQLLLSKTSTAELEVVSDDDCINNEF